LNLVAAKGRAVRLAFSAVKHPFPILPILPYLTQVAFLNNRVKEVPFFVKKCKKAIISCQNLQLFVIFLTFFVYFFPLYRVCLY